MKMIRGGNPAIRMSQRSRLPSAVFETVGLGLVIVTLLNPAGLLQDEEGLTVDALQRHCCIRAEQNDDRLQKDSKLREEFLAAVRPALFLTALSCAKI